MLMLLFQLDENRYALDSSEVIEILPVVGIKAIPRAPVGLAGLFNYRGAPVPVVDLTALVLGRASQAQLSTRIVLVRASGTAGRLIGLMAENVTETLRIDPTLAPLGPANLDTAFLGPVLTLGDAFVQCIRIDQILPETITALLDQQLVATG